MTDKVEELLTRVSALEAAVGIGHNGGPQLDDEVPPANDVRLSKNATAKRYSVSPRTIERTCLVTVCCMVALGGSGH
jgi:hypothetical protein